MSTLQGTVRVSYKKLYNSQVGGPEKELVGAGGCVRQAAEQEKLGDSIRGRLREESEVGRKGRELCLLERD